MSQFEMGGKAKSVDQIYETDSFTDVELTKELLAQIADLRKVMVLFGLGVTVGFRSLVDAIEHFGEPEDDPTDDQFAGPPCQSETQKAYPGNVIELPAPPRWPWDFQYPGVRKSRFNG